MKSETTNNPAQEKARVQAGFDKWSSGTGNFFELLSEDATWTIGGNSPFSRTYVGKKELMNTVIASPHARPASVIVPKAVEDFLKIHQTEAWNNAIQIQFIPMPVFNRETNSRNSQ